MKTPASHLGQQSVAIKQPIYRGPEPDTYRGFTFGVERLADIVEDIKWLHRQHWNETERLYQTGDCDPDYDRMIALEKMYSFLMFVVRDEDNTIVGNLVYNLTYSLHKRGQLNAYENAFYLAKSARTGHLAMKVMDYAERILTELGVHCLTIGDKSPAGGVSIAKLATRRGYQPISVGYMKNLEAPREWNIRQ